MESAKFINPQPLVALSLCSCTTALGLQVYKIKFSSMAKCDEDYLLANIVNNYCILYMHFKSPQMKSRTTRIN